MRPINVNARDVFCWIINHNKFRDCTGSLYRMMRISYIYKKNTKGSSIKNKWKFYAFLATRMFI